MVDVAAVVVAAGRGTRAGGDTPKQFRTIGGETMLRRALYMLVEHPQVGAIQPVIHPDDVERFRAIESNDHILAPVFGGATRQASVRAGLEALAARKPDIVLIHDAARPFASQALISRAIRNRGAERRRGAGLGGQRYGEKRRRQRHGQSDARPQYAAADPDAAGVCLCAAPGRACARGRSKAGRISPTTPGSPNGPASR